MYIDLSSDELNRLCHAVICRKLEIKDILREYTHLSSDVQDPKFIEDLTIEYDDLDSIFYKLV